MELPSFIDVCRLCLANEGDFIPIFEVGGHEKILWTKITECLPLKISQNDELPKRICQNCLDTIERIENYRNITVNAERQLYKLLAEAKSKQLTEPAQEESDTNTPQIKEYGSVIKGAYIKYICDSEESTDSAAYIEGPEPRDVVVAEYQQSQDTAVYERQSPSPPTPPPQLPPPPLQATPPMPKKLYLSPVPIQQLASRYSPNIMVPGVKSQQPIGEKTLVIKTEVPLEKECTSGPKLEASDFCEEQFTPVQLVTHRQTHTGEHSFACSDCGAAFISKRALKTHGLKHRNERPFSCDICHRTFKLSYVLTAHKKIHLESNKYVCDICGYSCALKSSMNLHLKRHFNDYKVKCDICEKGFYTNSELRLHLEWHKRNNKHRCTDCGSIFKTQNRLQEHSKKHKPCSIPPVVEKHYCKICGKCFASDTYLRRHEKLHTGEKKQLCTLCGKVFCSSEYLKIHMRTHTGEKPVKCDVCGKAFICKKYLRTHMRTHTGERPYQCSVCGKTFTQAASLGVHRRSSSRCSASQFVCHCGEAFNSNDLLADHRKTHSTQKMTVS